MEKSGERLCDKTYQQNSEKVHKERNGHEKRRFHFREPHHRDAELVRKRRSDNERADEGNKPPEKPQVENVHKSFRLRFFYQLAEILRQSILHETKKKKIADEGADGAENRRPKNRTGLRNLPERDYRRRRAECGGEKHSRDEATDEFHLLRGLENKLKRSRFYNQNGKKDAESDE